MGGGEAVGGNSQSSENKNEKWFKRERVTNINMCAQCDLRVNVAVKKSCQKILKIELASPRI